MASCYFTVPRRRPQVLPGDQLHLRHPPGVAVDELTILPSLHRWPEQTSRFVLCSSFSMLPRPVLSLGFLFVHRVAACVYVPFSMRQLSAVLTPLLDSANVSSVYRTVRASACSTFVDQGLVFPNRLLISDFRAMKLRSA